MAGYESNSGGFCRWCNAPLVGAFCNKCGRPVGYPTVTPANARPGWQTPRRSTGALVALVVSGVLALALFVAVPLGVVVHSLLQRTSAASQPAGGYGGRSPDSPSGGYDDYSGGYDGYGEDYWDYYENYRDYFGSYEEYRDFFGSFGDEYGGYEDYGDYGDYYDDFMLNETYSTRVDVMSSLRNSEHEALEAGQILVTVEVQLTNIDHSTIIYDPAAFELASPTGKLTPALVEGPFYDFLTALQPGSLLPGGYTTGLVTFLVPEDDFSFTLYYTDPNDDEMLQVPLV